MGERERESHDRNSLCGGGARKRTMHKEELLRTAIPCLLSFFVCVTTFSVVSCTWGNDVCVCVCVCVCVLSLPP